MGGGWSQVRSDLTFNSKALLRIPCRSWKNVHWNFTHRSLNLKSKNSRQITSRMDLPRRMKLRIFQRISDALPYLGKITSFELRVTKKGWKEAKGS